MSEAVVKTEQESFREKPMVDLAYMILKQTKQAYTFEGLVQEVFKLKEFGENDDVLDYRVQLFTELNIDGRFAYVGQQNEWGLKQWYSIEQLESAHFNRFVDDEDSDFDYDEQEEDLDLASDDDVAIEDDFDVEEADEEIDEDLEEDEESDDFEETDDEDDDLDID